MGMKMLCERLGASYVVQDSQNVKIYLNDECVWSYWISYSSALSGLFKEIYGEAMEKIIPGNPLFSIDKDDKK